MVYYEKEKFRNINIKLYLYFSFLIGLIVFNLIENQFDIIISLLISDVVVKGKIVNKALILENDNVDEAIKELFEKAIENCKK